MVAYILSFTLLLLFIAGCGKNRPKRAPILVNSEKDYFFDTKVNNSEDLIEMLRPSRGKFAEFDVTDEMLQPNWRWGDKIYFTKTPVWPEPKEDVALGKRIDAVKAGYEKELEYYKSTIRKSDLEAVAKHYMTYATVAKKDRVQQSFDNWKQYLRRQGKEGVALRKKLETNLFDMATTTDPAVSGQIIAYYKEPEKDGKNLVATVGKNPGDPPLFVGMKSDVIKDRIDEQFMLNFAASYLAYGADANKRNADVSVEGLKDYIRQYDFPQLAEQLDDKSIALVDFTQPKMLYVALARKTNSEKGALVLMKSGSIGRQKLEAIEKFFPP